VVAQVESTSSGAPLGSMRFKIDPAYKQLGVAGPYFPERAQRMNVEGDALIACHIGADSHLNDCVVREEKPLGFGFGSAALKMARDGWIMAARPDSDQPHTPDGWVLARIDYPASGGFRAR
jgi:hypothetical protein